MRTVPTIPSVPLHPTHGRRGGGAPLTLRQQVEGLRTQATPNGRTSLAPLKVIGIDAPPPGVTVTSTQVIIGAGISGTFENWNAGARTIVADTAFDGIENCIAAAIRLTANADLNVIRYNSLIGAYGPSPVVCGLQTVPSGTGVSATCGKVALVEYNRIVGQPSDAVQLGGDSAGDMIFQWNYIGPPVNAPAGTAEWSAATTYSVGEYVRVGKYAYQSLQNGNLNNPPPSGKASNAYWQNYDPHADALNPRLGIGRQIYRRNFIDYDASNEVSAISASRIVGINNAFRPVRNTGSDLVLGEIVFENNLIRHNGGPDADSIPIQIAPGVFDNFNGPIRINNNWLEPGGSANTTYFHLSSHTWVDEWTGNVDANTDVAVPGPTLRSAATAPVNTVLPSISGTATEGQTLTAATGTWTGTATVSFTYQWRRNGTPIGGATRNTYIPVAADVGTVLSVAVRAGNGGGTATAISSDTATVASANPNVPPANTVLPVISGTITEGHILSVSDGTWTGTPAPTFTYQWRRDGTDIDSATSAAYLLGAGDVSATITCAVTATNAAGVATAVSLGVGPVLASKRVVVVADLSQSPGHYWTEASFASTVVTPETLLTESDTFIGMTPDRSAVITWPITNANAVGSLGRLNGGVARLSRLIHDWHEADLLTSVPAEQSLELVIVQLTKSGSSRRWMMQDDSLSGLGGRPAEDPGQTVSRDFTDDLAVIAAAEAYGPIDLVVEDRFTAADNALLKDYLLNFAPFMLGERAGGQSFALGSVNPDSSLTQFVDYCMYDVASGSVGSKGRGALARTTSLSYVLGTNNISQDLRDGYAGFFSDSRVQVFAGPRTHEASIHAHEVGADHSLRDHVYGNTNSALPTALAIGQYLGLKASSSGPLVHLPILSHSFDPDGAYVDLTVSNAPPGSFISTIAAQDGIADLTTDDAQSYMGFMLQRIGDAEVNRQPIMNTASGQAASRKGTVTRPSDLTLRVTFTEALVNGEIVSLGNIDESIETSPARPSGVPQSTSPHYAFRWKPVLVIPALRNGTATHKYPGIPLPVWSAQFENPPPLPPADPSVLGTYTQTATLSQLESSSFTVPSGNGVLFVFLAYSSSITSGDETITHATFGSSGRAQGTGTAMTRILDLDNRTSRAVSMVFAHENPGAGSYTFQYGLGANASQEMRMCFVWVADAALPVDQAAGAPGTTVSPVAFTPTPLVSTSLFLYHVARSNASLGEFTISGATKLDDGNGGGAGATNTIQGVIGWAKHASLAQQSVSVSWSGGSANRAGAYIEVTR